jgi:hypothetical protein
MPLVLALLASALLHAAALIGSAWELPGLHEPEPPATIEAVLAKPAPRREAEPAVKPVPRTLARKPRPGDAAPSTLVSDAAPLALAAPGEAAPVAVPPAPTIEPVVEPVVEPKAPQPARTALPGRGSRRYVITRGEGGFVIGQAVHSWQHDGFTYKLKSMTETTGLVAVFKPAQVFQSSQGEVTEDGLRPREYRHERSGGTDTASFDWLRRVVAYAGRVESIVGGTQDFLSMYYQLVLLAPKSGYLEMPIATGRKLETYRFDVLGEETVNLPSGERKALHLRTRSGNDTIDVWIAPESRGLPLKIRFTDRKGEIFDQLAADIDPQETQ